MRSPEVRERVCEAYDRPWFREAPVIAVFTGLHGENWIRKSDNMDYLLCDVTILSDYFVLAATEKGLGSCIIAAFDPEKVSVALDLPKNEIPFFLTPVGYVREGAHRERVRKELKDIVKIY